MNTIRRQKTARFRSAINGLLPIIIFFVVLPQGSSTAMLGGTALVLVVFCFSLDFTPTPLLDPRGTRAKAGFICLTAACVTITAYFVVQSFVQGHLP
jgi:hypothetical protein